MPLRITVDVFSGRPNPVIELEGTEAREALGRLKPAGKLKADEVRPVPEARLGYRGLVVEQVGERDKKLPKVFRVVDGELSGPRLAHRAADATYGQSLLDATGPLARLELGGDFFKVLDAQVESLREFRAEPAPRPTRRRRPKRCKCGPLYEPAWWNDGGPRQFNNNCYNYATNYRTDTFAQPGQAAGALYTALTCAAVHPAAEKDDLITARVQDNVCPDEGHLVALVIAPGFDFHWYRKGRDGLWTHKVGGSPATDLDNSGATIVDPRTADRGPYTDFCRFMIVMHGHVKIQ
jgi:hypothetical protein